MFYLKIDSFYWEGGKKEKGTIENFENIFALLYVPNHRESYQGYIMHHIPTSGAKIVIYNIKVIITKREICIFHFISFTNQCLSVCTRESNCSH